MNLVEHEHEVEDEEDFPLSALRNRRFMRS
jgi:hypothetical protein